MPSPPRGPLGHVFKPLWLSQNGLLIPRGPRTPVGPPAGDETVTRSAPLGGDGHPLTGPRCSCRAVLLLFLRRLTLDSCSLQPRPLHPHSTLGSLLKSHRTCEISPRAPQTPNQTFRNSSEGRGRVPEPPNTLQPVSSSPGGGLCAACDIQAWSDRRQEDISKE